MKTASGLIWKSPSPILASNKSSIDIHPIIQQTLTTRGVPPQNWAMEINPSNQCNPSELVDLERAASRVARAIRSGEMIAVIGDYDVDGACASALIARTLSLYNAQFSIHIPDRIAEGYGPSVWAIDSFAAAGATVLITLDCGSTANSALNRAAHHAIDVVVLDHHKISETVPPTFALVNPTRSDDSSGLQRLSAAGIAQIFTIELDKLLDNRLDPSEGLDLATLALVADVMPFCGANRALARVGLAQMHGDTIRPGLAALFRQVKMREAPTAGDLGWKIAPRINAGGRIGDPSLGWRLLATTDTEQAADIARQLDLLNDDRRLIEKAAVVAAIEAFDAEFDQDCAVIVLHNEALPPGVAGLVAARLRERYNRPAIALAGIDPVGGSARSTPAIDIGALIHKAVHAGIASKGGGHAMAAGLTLPASNIPLLRFFLESEISALPKIASQSFLPIDATASPADFTRMIFEQTQRLGPYANNHAPPLIQLNNCTVENLTPMGQGHMRCEIVSNANRCRAFAFNVENTDLLALARHAQQGRTVDTAGIMEASAWTPKGQSELKLSDIRNPD